MAGSGKLKESIDIILTIGFVVFFCAVVILWGCGK